MISPGRLAAAGINTLTFDMRGFGESGGRHQGWPRQDSPVKKIWGDDIDTAWQYLVSQPGVNGHVIGLGGAGIVGVDNAVLTARRHAAEVKSLVLLSGETFLPGQQFLRQASQLPGLFVVSDDDEGPPTEEVMEWIYGISSNPGKQFIHYPVRRLPGMVSKTPKFPPPELMEPICSRVIPSYPALSSIGL